MRNFISLALVGAISATATKRLYSSGAPCRIRKERGPAVVKS